MKRGLTVMALVSLLGTGFAAGGAAHAPDGVRFTGDVPKAKEVWREFQRWLAAYSQGDRKGVMEIFDREIEFSYQGAPDQRYADLESSYVEDFRTRDKGSEWVPIVEEVHAAGSMGFVRAVWELRVRTADGRSEVRGRNRSMDVLRAGEDGRWRIFRSVNYPAPALDDASWERQVRAAEEKHRAAFLSRDVAALEEMFSDDFVVNSPLNTVVDKKQLLEMVRRGALSLASFEQQIERIRRAGDVVFVMGGDTVVYAVPSPLAGQTHRRRFTDAWRLEGGRWRFIARQAGIICP